MGAARCWGCSLCLRSLQPHLPPAHQPFCFSEPGIHVFRLSRHNIKSLFFPFIFYFFERETLNKFHSLDQNKQLKIQIQGCPTLITVHQGSISCLYIERMRIHHPCQRHWTPNSNVKPNVRGHTFPLLTKSVIHKYYCYQTLHLQHLFRNMHM